MGGDSQYSIYIGQDVSALWSPFWSRGSWGRDLISHSSVVQHHLSEGEGKKTPSDAFMFRPHSYLWLESPASLGTICQR